MPAYAVSTVVPEHVSPELRYDYDVYDPGPPGSDFHVELYRLKQTAPPVFWTPYNGGHWYVTDAKLAREMLTDPDHFSNKATTLPVSLDPRRGFIPVVLDPPEHEKYRAPLSLGLSRKAVAELEPGVRALAIELIEALKPKGSCEFMADFAAKLPVITFLRLFDLPLDDRTWLLEVVDKIMRPGSDKADLLGKLAGYLFAFIQKRRVDPGGDLMSWLGEREIDGERITEAKLLNMCTLLLIGGLESVTNTVGFIGKFLAESPAHRRQIRETPAILSAAVEEMLRRFPTTAVGTGRYCVQDTRLGEVEIKAGDMMMTSTAMLNFDEATYPNPLEVDFSRRISRVGTFGEGVHRCVGAGLTRVEISIFVQEWLNRIPEFELADAHVEFQAGPNISYDRLMLRWPTA